MIENVLIVDTETTGLHPDKGDQLIEIAAVLYNIKHKTILQQFSTLFPCDANPVEHINGISAESTREEYPLEFVNSQLKIMLQSVGAVVAHNAQFDRKFVRELKLPEFDEMPWICTKADFEWPVNLHRNRLEDVCVSMGVPYIDAHRALNDCRLIAACFDRVVDLAMRLNNALNRSGRQNGYSAKGNQYYV